MGGRNSISKNFTRWRLSRKRGNSKLKRTTFCPICQLEFKSWQTYDDFNYHIDNCLLGGDLGIQAYAPKLHSKYSPFEEKIDWIREQFNSIRVPWSEEHQKIFISRENLLEDSFREIQNLNDREMRSEFQIQFIGEIAMDAGGVMKEWVNILIKLLFDESMQLFCRAKTEEVSYLISPNGKQMELFYFTGKLLAKAVFENIPVNCPLCRTLYKHLLGVEVEFEDVKFQDIELYNSLKMIADNQIEDVFVGCFAMEKAGDMYELIPNGSEVSITEENKAEYIEYRCRFETLLSMQPGLSHFKRGFFAVFPQSMISTLNPEEFELMLCGKPVIDIEEWSANTEYKGDFTCSHKVVKWFWAVLAEFSHEELAQLLVFVTGSSRVPIDGFGKLKTLRGDPAKFTLQSIEHYKKALPRAHTCFNRLDLPLYPSKVDVKNSLKFVIKNHSLGFGLE